MKTAILGTMITYSNHATVAGRMYLVIKIVVKLSIGLKIIGIDARPITVGNHDFHAACDRPVDLLTNFIEAPMEPFPKRVSL